MSVFGLIPPSYLLARITSGQTQLYPHQVEALLSLYQKACKGEMDGSYRSAALILAGVGTGKTLMQTLVPYILAPWMQGEQALMLSDILHASQPLP